MKYSSLFFGALLASLATQAASAAGPRQCVVRKCAVVAEAEQQIQSRCWVMYSNNEQSLARQMCVFNEEGNAPKTCRTVKYDCNAPFGATGVLLDPFE